MNITINTEQSQYVKTFVEGCTTWGFQNAFDETALLAERLGHPELAPFMADYGTEEVLKKYAKLIKLAAKDPRLGTWFKKGTPDAVKKVIDRLIHTGEKVRVFYGDPKTGKSTLDEFDMIGSLARSTGVLKTPLLLSESDGFGAPLLDDKVIRIIRVSDHKNLYKHPGFHVPEMKIVEGEHHQFKASVVVEGTVAARFRSYAKACKWVAFMAGETVEQPE